MDALFIYFAVIAVLAVLGSAAFVFGAESRDGFI